MAIPQYKPKAISKTCPLSKSRISKDKVQMHRRSRNGCYTCRLRRKKCDEGTPSCTACRHLGLKCDYKRPVWWGNNEQRRLQKENIKLIIKRRKLVEKSASSGSHIMSSRSHTSIDFPHSVSAPLDFLENHDRSRSASIDSQVSMFDFRTQTPSANCYISDVDLISNHAHYAAVFPEYFPIQEESHKDSDYCAPQLSSYSESTNFDFNNFQPDTVCDSILPLLGDEFGWDANFLDSNQEIWHNNISPSESLFDYNHSASSDFGHYAFDLSTGDRRLLGFFISDVLPIAFPILEMNLRGSARTHHVISALQRNKCYLHCCLSIAAQHLKASQQTSDNQIDEDVMRHRDITISELCGALDRDSYQDSTLEAMLGLIIFQGCVGRLEDTLPDIPWHQHFQAATSLVQKLDLHRLSGGNIYEQGNLSLNMTLTAWIDILGATMLGRAPIFAHTYRERHLSEINSSLGLQSLMGCDDNVLYLISEIACLEALKNGGMGEFELCHHVEQLGYQISLTENGDAGSSGCFNKFGELLPEQVSRNVTDAFRIAARIYLCSLVPGFRIIDDKIMALINKLTQLLTYIPSGPSGFDRSLVWVYLIAGSATVTESPFRAILSERLEALGDKASFGCLGRVSCILKEVWGQIDDCIHENSSIGYVSWRDVMQSMGWDYLLI
ncbi:Transcriptional regulatory protein pro1 [Erysiphe necator]|uniref:Putative transcriptional regulatory protein pro-1 n=1 Tax=Uncinula necator TaxID=52586 RepID=A0A0B1NZE8_UNCNE|nr:Transcriptional regulatory protein pro1 [Erysiphe necator]KHJ31752.1 putative transcriptional regulatory protein pro-1 [Erysiphe necator]